MCNIHHNYQIHYEMSLICPAWEVVPKVAIIFLDPGLSRLLTGTRQGRHINHAYNVVMEMWELILVNLVVMVAQVSGESCQIP